MSEVIDYAGCFPPASLPLAEAVENYRAYKDGPFGWMLGRFVVGAEDVSNVPAGLDGQLAIVGLDHPRATTVEVRGVAHFDKPTYCETPVGSLEAVQQAGSFAKLRTGGVVASAIPDCTAISEFMTRCARLQVSFKATAGLHHAVRGIQPLTYAPDAPVACMHGFLNVLFASCWLWNHGESADVNAILNETDADAFRFENDSACWRDCVLTADQIQSARRDFMHSFGSCSFAEPVAELEQLRWL